MKTSTIEELAEIAADARHSFDDDWIAWKDLGVNGQKVNSVGMQAAITALYASVEGMPSVDEIKHAAWNASRECDRGGNNNPDAGSEAIRNLMLTAHLKAVAGMQAKLEAVAKLPEKWDDLDTPVLADHQCVDELRAALATNEEKPAIAPVPEVNLWSITWTSGEGEEPQIRGSEMIVRRAWKEKERNKGHWKMWDEKGVLVAEDADGFEVWSPPLNEVPVVGEHADLKAAAERGEWLQRGISKDEWELPVQFPEWAWMLPPECYRVVSTIQHDGKLWFKHTPGDEMPVGGDVDVSVLFRDKTTTATVKASEWNWSENHTDGSIIGYYPVSLAEALGNAEKPKEHVQPPAGLVLHNPDGLTPEQVGEGYRLPGPDEVTDDFKCDHWNGNRWFLAGRVYAKKFRDCKFTYRVPITTPWPEVPAEVKPEKWADEKKAHAEGMRIEWQHNRGWYRDSWHPCRNAPKWADDKNYRVAPGQDTDPKALIPRERLLELCGGREPHRWDFTEEMLADGQRPLCDGEARESGDEFSTTWSQRSGMAHEWALVHGAPACENKAYHGWCHHRTRRPIPAPAETPVELQADMMTVGLLYDGMNKRMEKRMETAEERVRKLDTDLSETKRGWQLLNDMVLGAIGEERNPSRTVVEMVRDRVKTLESRIAALTPRPVSVKPTREDTDPEGEVLLLYRDGALWYVSTRDRRQWDEQELGDAFWLPGNLAKLMPEAPAVDKERAEFEAWWKISPHVMSKYANEGIESVARIAWQAARARKEASK